MNRRYTPRERTDHPAILNVRLQRKVTGGISSQVLVWHPLQELERIVGRWDEHLVIRIPRADETFLVSVSRS